MGKKLWFKSLLIVPALCVAGLPASAQQQGSSQQQTGDPVAAKQMALQSLDNLRQQQASALAYFDTFLVFAVLAGALTFLVLLMKRSVAEKGAHVAAE